jgi:purine-binding chemotaxis protein CheW
VSVLHVLFKVGGAEYAIPASEVLHMDAYTGATRVPGAAPFVAGLVQVRGRVVPVVDLRARFGLPPRADTDEAAREARVVVVKGGERVVGLLADSAREVVKLEPEAVRPPPELVTAAGGVAFVRAIAQAGERLLMLLDVAKVIGPGDADVVVAAAADMQTEQRHGQ